MTSHSQESERLDLRKRFFKKKHWVDFCHSRVVVNTHCQYIFQSKCKSEFSIFVHNIFTNAILHLKNNV